MLVDEYDAFLVDFAAVDEVAEPVHGVLLFAADARLTRLAEPAIAVDVVGEDRLFYPEDVVCVVDRVHRPDAASNVVLPDHTRVDHDVDVCTPVAPEPAPPEFAGSETVVQGAPCFRSHVVCVRRICREQRRGVRSNLVAVCAAPFRP